MNDAADFWMEETNEILSTPSKMKRKVRPKKIEFVGWGSKPLIDFLQSIGKDTIEPISRYDVHSIINDYINTHNLIDPQKKKRVVCDEGLHHLFGKRYVLRIRIYELLNTHFAENQNESDDDFFYSSAEEDKTPAKSRKLQKGLSSDGKGICQTKKVPEIPKSCFAAIIPANIKLVHLKKSLVQDLLKHPETFEAKVVGCFVRVKSDPNDYFQKNTHQLLHVIGVTYTSTVDDICPDILLQVSSIMKVIHISKLSDDNFSEEECEDLRQRIKSGSQKRPTVVEFQQKAQMLHEDITKHWLAREINLLQNQIDRANEKGWRKELFEYLERKQLLQKPAEQSRLLLEVPEVIADEIEPEVTAQDGSTISAISPSGVALEDSTSELELNKTSAAPSTVAADAVSLTQIILGGSSLVSKGTQDFVREDACNKEPEEDNHVVLLGEETKSSSDKQVMATTRQEVIVVVSDDDEEEEDCCYVVAEEEEEEDHPILYDQGGGSSIWHYMDPQGEVQGPFSLELLQHWSDANYFSPDFRVWRAGQGPEEAVLLTHLLLGGGGGGVPSESPQSELSSSIYNNNNGLS